jgi:hypothetical protein
VIDAKSRTLLAHFFGLRHEPEDFRLLLGVGIIQYQIDQESPLTDLLQSHAGSV